MEHIGRISVVVPVYNEAGNIASLHSEIRNVVAPLAREHEIIYINDGSTDGTLADLKSLQDATIINLNRNYGQATALDAGFSAATGDIVVSLDGDGQNDPADVPRLLEKLFAENLDVVAGFRMRRRDRGGIKVITRIARLLRRAFINDGVHDSGCTLRVYRLEAVKSLDLQGEMHRFIIGLLRWKGFTIGELPVNDRVRIHGVSKYGYSKAVRGFIDLVYIWFIHKYSQRPLHLFGYMSLGSFVLGGLSFLWSIFGKLFYGLSLNRNGWFFIAFFFLLAGIMLFSFGVVLDLLIRISFNTSSNEKRYYVRDVTKL